MGIEQNKIKLKVVRALNCDVFDNRTFILSNQNRLKSRIKNFDFGLNRIIILNQLKQLNQNNNNFLI